MNIIVLNEDILIFLYLENRPYIINMNSFIRKRIKCLLTYLISTDEVILNDNFKKFFKLYVNKIKLTTLLNIIEFEHTSTTYGLVKYGYFQKPIEIIAPMSGHLVRTEL
jgi:hypothetical protein